MLFEIRLRRAKLVDKITATVVIVCGTLGTLFVTLLAKYA